MTTKWNRWEKTCKIFLWKFDITEFERWRQFYRKRRLLNEKIVFYQTQWIRGNIIWTQCCGKPKPELTFTSKEKIFYFFDWMILENQWHRTKQIPICVRWMQTGKLLTKSLSQAKEGYAVVWHKDHQRKSRYFRLLNKLTTLTKILEKKSKDNHWKRIIWKNTRIATTNNKLRGPGEKL